MLLLPPCSQAHSWHMTACSPSNHAGQNGALTAAAALQSSSCAQLGAPRPWCTPQSIHDSRQARRQLPQHCPMQYTHMQWLRQAWAAQPRLDCPVSHLQLTYPDAGHILPLVPTPSRRPQGPCGELPTVFVLPCRADGGPHATAAAAAAAAAAAPAPPSRALTPAVCRPW